MMPDPRELRSRPCSPSAPKRAGRLRGRGAGFDPANRFQAIEVVPDPEERAPETGEAPSPATRFLRDPSRSVVSFNRSPDVGFEASVNPYRGCEHGCIYCYARPTHEYLDFSAGLDFETRILAKPDAPALLRAALASPSWTPRVLALSGVTDPYQPIERRLRITRGCLEVLADWRNPVLVVTKSGLVVRDADLLRALASVDAAAVCLSVTTLDAALHRRMEPRAPRPALRLRAVESLARAGIPVGVLVAPIVPGLNDHEIPAILRAAAAAGARFASRVLLRLPGAVAPLFDDWLARHFPDRRQKVMNAVRGTRGGRLNDPRFGHRMRGSGPLADSLHAMFELACRREGLTAGLPALSADAFRPEQPDLFA